MYGGGGSGQLPPTQSLYTPQTFQPPPPQQPGQGQQFGQHIPLKGGGGIDYNNGYQQEQTINYQQQPQQNDFQTPNFNTQLPGHQQQQHMGIVEQPQQSQLPPPVVEQVKRDIPPEYVHIQKTFEGLRLACIQASNNPQTKRKLDDVAKRLELLYDFLRDLRVSLNYVELWGNFINRRIFGCCDSVSSVYFTE